ncbi:MAG: hypothetical protein GX918_07845 [Clostridiales bacterium]|jgi:hypothetical protein|nr:hypothetical protein [Clostridiales bacterium]
MYRRVLATFLTLVLLIYAAPLAQAAEVSPPKTLGAPENLGASHYSGSVVNIAFSAPKDLRTYIEKRAADDPINKRTFSAYFQVDYKIDGGGWHHTPDWDSPETVPDKIDDLYFTFASGKKYHGSDRWPMTTLFPGDDALKAFHDAGWDYLKSHSVTFRVRFAHSFDYGDTYVLSPWSKEYTLSANAKEDYNKLINHAPTLLSADLKATASGEPYFDIKVAQIPADVAYLHSISGCSVRTEVWMRRAGDQDYKYIEYEWVDSELLNIEASDYFSAGGTQQSYDAESYEIKVRYAFDLRKHKQSGYAGNSSSVDIYGPFSNVISHNMPSWSEASDWAMPELKKADDAGLIPNILKGADLTKPITREEFCELALALYEKSTGKSPAPASPNPFTDTNNPQILKAFALGITQGTSATTFSPEVLINREQCATMLFRAIKAIVPGGNYSVAGIPDFPDQKDISSYAVDATKFMSKLGIVKGDTRGYFMPKATTTAQQASGYGMATREAAILMSVRTYDQVDEIEEAPADNAPEATSPSVAGTWILGTLSGGRFNAATGKYEGGASGLGQRYTFKSDGTYTALVIWSNAMFFTGKYSVKNGVLTLTDRAVEESSDDGMTWGAREALPDTSAHFTAGTDDTGKYLLLGEEGAVPPLADKTNALKYKLLDIH